jgi:hypothetical protein
LRYPTKRLGTKEAEMKIVGCDLHAKQQTIAMVDTGTGEFIEKTLPHEGSGVGEFYAALEGPVVVGIEATGAMQWFLELVVSSAARRADDNCADGYVWPLARN